MTVRQFSNIDRVKWQQHVHIRWEMVEVTDESAGPPDEMDEGFWPSKDKRAPGYVGEVSLDELATLHDQAQRRYDQWQAGNWNYVGIIARAHLFIPIGGQAFFMLDVDSSGLWGIESDDYDYKKQVFEEQKSELLSNLMTLGQQIDTAILLKE